VTFVLLAVFGVLVCEAVVENLAGRDLIESVGDGLVIGMVDDIHVRSVWQETDITGTGRDGCKLALVAAAYVVEAPEACAKTSFLASG
jgi:hypothetical protein